MINNKIDVYTVEVGYVLIGLLSVTDDSIFSSPEPKAQGELL